MFLVSKARFITVLALLLAYVVTGGLQAKEVTLRNKDGKSLSARLVTLNGDKLTVLRDSDKKQFVLSLAQLDDVSRAEVDVWLQAGGGLSERFVVDVRSGKRQRSSGEYYSDEKKVDIEPLVVVKNPDANIRTREVKVTAVLLGRPVADRNAYHVFSVESFTLPSLEGGKEGAFQMKPVSRTFDDRGDYKYGARYLGWVVVISDPEDDRVIHAQSIPEPLAGKLGGKFLKVEAGSTYDENLRLMKNFNAYSN
jgi:hypothetical protein